MKTSLIFPNPIQEKLSNVADRKTQLESNAIDDTQKTRRLCTRKVDPCLIILEIDCGFILEIDCGFVNIDGIAACPEVKLQPETQAKKKKTNTQIADRRIYPGAPEATRRRAAEAPTCWQQKNKQGTQQVATPLSDTRHLMIFRASFHGLQPTPFEPPQNVCETFKGELAKLTHPTLWHSHQSGLQPKRKSPPPNCSRSASPIILDCSRSASPTSPFSLRANLCAKKLLCISLRRPPATTLERSLQQLSPWHFVASFVCKLGKVCSRIQVEALAQAASSNHAHHASLASAPMRSTLLWIAPQAREESVARCLAPSQAPAQTE